MLGWVTRCLPGFSLIGLAVMLLCAFTDILESPILKDFLPQPSMPHPIQTGPWGGMGLAQKIFIVYTILIHIHTFGFTLRLAWSMSKTIQATKEIFQRRPQTLNSPSASPQSTPESPEYQLYHDQPPSPVSLPDPTISPFDKREFVTVHELTEDELIHAIILPNYREDLQTLETTLKVLASHPRAKSQYEIYLAMEQKEIIAADKAAHLVSTFEQAFLDIHTTFHQADIEGEIAGKSSNVACAARRIIEVHRTELKMDCCNVMVTVMDADTHLSRDYFNEILRLHYFHLDEADRSIYCCPILFDRNSHEVPALVRCADLMWGFAGLSTMYPGTWISIPTSVYSLPLSLAEKVGGWDSDPTAIGEDMHMLLKCYFETAGNIISRVVHSPASQCNVSSDSRNGWRRTVDTCLARYRQALRHMWGALDTGFAARRTLGYLRFHQRCSFLHPRHFALLSLLWEAHFLPAHLTIVMIFSVIYKFLTPVSQMHPTLVWAFTVTEILRLVSFVGMNGNLFLYERWHKMCLDSRMEDMQEAKISDTGCARRVWHKPQFLIDRICFPIAGTVFGAIPTLHAVLSHFWTDRLVYRVSKKPTFSLDAVGLA